MSETEDVITYDGDNFLLDSEAQSNSKANIHKCAKTLNIIADVWMDFAGSNTKLSQYYSTL